MTTESLYREDLFKKKKKKVLPVLFPNPSSLIRRFVVSIRSLQFSASKENALELKPEDCAAMTKYQNGQTVTYTLKYGIFEMQCMQF